MLGNVYRKIVPLSLREKLRFGWALRKTAARIAVTIKKAVLLSIPPKEKRSKIRFGIHLAEHCNLHCASCNNFSNIAEPEFVDIEEFKRDFERMGEIFGHECELVYLLGGEPLLNPEINTLIKMVRDNFNEGSIILITNGILLSKKDDDFWKTCHDTQTEITVSAYPIKIDVDTIRSLAEKFGVNVRWAWGDNPEANEFRVFEKAVINLKGNSDVPLNFAFCYRANDCIQLSHGHLFTCTFAPHVHHFNKYFGQNIRITPADYVNIYDDVTADEILTKMAEPIPACRYCDTLTARKIKWSLSKKEISEWL